MEVVYKFFFLIIIFACYFIVRGFVIEFSPAVLQASMI
jgi:hypothetical protein